jgi:predicted phage terminase large subunit-like protein
MPSPLDAFAHLLEVSLAEDSLREFIAQAWPEVEPAPFVPGWHIDAICEHLQAAQSRQIRDLLITIPPRHSKSLLTSVFFPCWVWARRPETKFLTASYKQDLATRDAVRSRRLMESPYYRNRWGDAWKFTSDQNEKRRYENDKGGYRIAIGTGTGTGDGGDILLVDDPLSFDQSLSEAERKAMWEWWTGTWATRGNDPKTVVRIVIQQRLHEEDLVGKLLKAGGWEHLNLPMEYEPARRCVTSIGWSDPRTVHGQLLAPERFDRESVDKLKASLGTYKASGQLQQSPSPAEGGVFKRNWWRSYRELPGGKLKFDEVLTSWDMSFKETSDGSFVVGQAWGRIGANKYLLDQVRARMDFSATKAAVEAFTGKWRKLADARLHLVEDKANGPAILSSLRAVIPGLVPVAVKGSKEARAHSVTPTVEAGNVWLPHPEHPHSHTNGAWVADFIEEAAGFPMAANDDQVDAMTQALDRLANGFTRENMQAR